MIEKCKMAAILTWERIFDKRKNKQAKTQFLALEGERGVYSLRVPARLGQVGNSEAKAEFN